MYRRNTDFRLRELARQALQGDMASRNQVLRSLMRVGQISPSVSHLLSMAGYGANPAERFSLAFCSTFTFQDDDNLIERENARIQYLRGIDEKFLVFKITLELLADVSQEVFSQDKKIFRILFKKLPPTEWLSAEKFKGKIFDSIIYLNSISPEHPPKQKTLEKWIGFYRFWSLAMSMETIRHIFLSLAGLDTDEDPCQGPFFMDSIYGGDHGLLNPHCHYTSFYEGALRIEELTDEQGKIDWYVVYSNIISGCYLAWGAIAELEAPPRLSALLSGFDEDLDETVEEAEELRSERLDYLDETSGFLAQMEALEESLEPLQEQLSDREDIVLADFDWEEDEAPILQADPQWAALAAQIAPFEAQMAMLNAQRDAIIENDSEFQRLENVLEVLGGNLENARAITAKEWRIHQENKFWEILATVIIKVTTDYYLIQI
jgi:hypothetical protein